MTNGEKIIAILKPRKDQIRIYNNWVEIEIQKLGINFSCELDWWNTECNEPSNKSIIYKAKESKEIQEDLDKLRKLNEPTTKNDLGVDYVSRQAVLNTLERMDKALDEDRTVDLYKELLKECYKVLPSITSQEPVLDKIRAEIDKARFIDEDTRIVKNALASGLETAMRIINKYKVESEEICQN